MYINIWQLCLPCATGGLQQIAVKLTWQLVSSAEPACQGHCSAALCIGPKVRKRHGTWWVSCAEAAHLVLVCLQSSKPPCWSCLMLLS
jgi:hypothetical protein